VALAAPWRSRSTGAWLLIDQGSDRQFFD